MFIGVYCFRVPKSHHKKPEKSMEIGPEMASPPPQKGVKTSDLPFSPISAPSGEAQPEAAAKPFTPRESEAGGEVHRVSIKLVNGKIAFDDLQDRTKKMLGDALKASASDPRMAELVGATGPAIPTGTVCTPEDAKFVLQIQVALVTAWASFKLKIGWNDAWTRINWNDAEHSLLDPKLAGVMTKYFPEELKANLDWVTFLGMWGGMTIVHWGQVARFAAEKEKLGKPSPPITITGPKEETPASVGETHKPNGDGNAVDAISTSSVSGLQP